MDSTSSPADGPGRSVNGWAMTRYPLSDIRTRGLLAVLNAEYFHPRGYALSLVLEDGGEDPIGFQVWGDGSEPWTYGDPIDDKLAAYHDMLATARKEWPEATKTTEPG